MIICLQKREKRLRRLEAVILYDLVVKLGKHVFVVVVVDILATISLPSSLVMVCHTDTEQEASLTSSEGVQWRMVTVSRVTSPVVSCLQGRMRRVAPLITARNISIM